MFTISKASWHYRWVRSVRRSFEHMWFNVKCLTPREETIFEDYPYYRDQGPAVPNNLCEYMRWAIVHPLWIVPLTVFRYTVLVVLERVVMGIAYAFLGVKLLLGTLRRVPPVSAVSTSLDSFDRLTQEWADIVHRQVCPLLRFEDDASS